MKKCLLVSLLLSMFCANVSAINNKFLKIAACVVGVACASYKVCNGPGWTKRPNANPEQRAKQDREIKEQIWDNF